MLNKYNAKRIVRSKIESSNNLTKSLIYLKKIQSSPQNSPSKSYQINERNYFIDQEFMDKMVHQKIIPFVTTQFSLTKKANHQAVASKGEGLAIRVIFRIVSRKCFQFNASKFLQRLKTISFSQKVEYLRKEKIQQFKRHAFSQLNIFVKYKNMRIATQKISRVYGKSQIISKNIAFWALKMRAKEKVLQTMQNIEKIMHRKSVISKFQGFQRMIQYVKDQGQDFKNTRKTIKRVHIQKVQRMVSGFSPKKVYSSEKSANQLLPDVLPQFKKDKNIKNIDTAESHSVLSKRQVYGNIELVKLRQKLVSRRNL